MAEGHGPLENILQHYTLAHINHFLPEIDRSRRHRFKEAIYAARAAQFTKDGFEKYMRELNAEERKRDSQLKLVHGGRAPMTYEERVKLEQQQHVKFNELSVDEQARLIAERESLWTQIPPHIQAKSRKLAGR